MWIKSQDEKLLVEVNQVTVTGNSISCHKWVLGTYEHEERAKQILRDITFYLSRGNKVYNMPER